MIKYNLLTISQIYELELAVLMYKYHKNILPHQLQNIFKMNNSQIKTRRHSKILMNYCKCSGKAKRKDLVSRMRLLYN